MTNPRTLPSDISVEDWLAYDNSKGDPVEVWLGRLSLKPIEIQNYLAGKTVDWEDMVFQKDSVKIIMQVFRERVMV